MHLQAILTAYGFRRRKRRSVATSSLLSRRGRSGDEMREGSADSAGLVQSRLARHSFSCTPRRPCYINILPSELLMRILEHMPFVEFVFTRVHAKASQLPRHDDDEAATSKDVEPWILACAAMQGDYATCLAEALFHNGCARFCDSKPWDYLDLMLVCRHWRSVIEACPRFWNRIPINNERTVQRSLELSGVTPLHVNMDGGYRWPSQWAVTSVLDHLHRFEELSARTVDDDVAANIISAFNSRPAPTLRSLYWSTLGPRKALITQSWKEQLFPSLESIIMHDVELTSPCPLFSSTLTTLILTRSLPPWNTAEELLQTLSRMPMLEVLFLWELPDVVDFEEPHFQPSSALRLPIPLLRLQILNLDGSYRYVHRIFRNLQIAPTISALNLNASHRAYGVEPATEAAQNYASFEAFAAAVSPPPSANFSQIDCDVDLDEGEIQISISNEENKRFYWKHMLDSDRAHHAGDVIDFVKGTCAPFLSRFSFTDLEVIVRGEFGGEFGQHLTPEACFGWLGQLRAVTTLQLTKDAASRIIPWMRRCLHEADGFALPFRSLQHMTISATSLAEHLGFPYSEDDPTDILFKHLWLYLHDQQPGILLRDVSCTHRMLKYIHNMLGPRFRTERASLIQGPHIRMEGWPYNQLYISFPPSTHETRIEAPYNP
ncbi:unnamed protein product [Peniophora sp. CBMAI 1063]|nr:unnamed protein product [Peniophora sp. CBMAI 1063]